MNKAMTIFAILIVMLLMGVDVLAYEKNHDCDKHPIYCQIVSNKPTIKRAFAFQLSNAIYKKSMKHKLDPVILTAILAQESMYKVSAKNCTTGIIESESFQGKSIAFGALDKCLKVGEVGSEVFVECVKREHTYTKVSVCTDFGIGQIWYKTADSYEFDIEKLTTDIDYSVEAAAIVLKDFKNRYAHKEQNWWTRYNASSTDARNKYKKLVEKYINP